MPAMENRGDTLVRDEGEGESELRPVATVTVGCEDTDDIAECVSEWLGEEEGTDDLDVVLVPDAHEEMECDCEAVATLLREADASVDLEPVTANDGGGDNVGG